MLCVITFHHKTAKNKRLEFFVQSHPSHTKGLIDYIDNMRLHLDMPYRRGVVYVEFVETVPKIFNNKQVGDATSSFWHITGKAKRGSYIYTINDKKPYDVTRKA